MHPMLRLNLKGYYAPASCLDWCDCPSEMDRTIDVLRLRRSAERVQQHDRGERDVDADLELPRILLERGLVAVTAVLDALEHDGRDERHRDREHLGDCGIVKVEPIHASHRGHHGAPRAAHEAADRALRVRGVRDRGLAGVGEHVGIGIKANTVHAVVDGRGHVERLRVEV